MTERAEPLETRALNLLPSSHDSKPNALGRLEAEIPARCEGEGATTLVFL